MRRNCPDVFLAAQLVAAEVVRRPFAKHEHHLIRPPRSVFGGRLRLAALATPDDRTPQRPPSVDHLDRHAPRDADGRLPGDPEAFLVNRTNPEPLCPVFAILPLRLALPRVVGIAEI